MDEKTLGELLEEFTDIIGKGTIKKLDANYHSIEITAYSMGPGRIRIDLKE